MYATIEAEIDHGRIIPLEPKVLPEYGKLLLTVISTTTKKPDLIKLKNFISGFKTTIDPVEWQRKIRSEWNHRT